MVAVTATQVTTPTNKMTAQIGMLAGPGCWGAGRVVGACVVTVVGACVGKVVGACVATVVGACVGALVVGTTVVGFAVVGDLVVGFAVVGLTVVGFAVGDCWQGCSVVVPCGIG